MSQRAKSLFVLLTMCVDILMVSLALYLAFELRSRVPFPTPLKLGAFDRYWALLVVEVVCAWVSFVLYRMYEIRRAESRVDLLYRIVAAVSIAAVTSTALAYLVYHSDRELTRGMVLYDWVLSIVLVLVGRVSVEQLLRLMRRRYPDRLLLVGTGEVARVILHKTIQSRSLGYKVVGFVDGDRGAADIAGVPMLGPRSELASIVREGHIHEVVIALPEASHDELLDVIAACESANATVRIFPDLFQTIASELSIDDLDGLPLLAVHNLAMRGWKLAVKRAMDVVVSAVGLVLLSPLLLLVALLIKLDSKGPVFYAQTRVGLDGLPFPTLKFRSMRTDAEQDTGPVWATADDPRRTRLGALLRKSSIDEFPQLINVLLGDMSLVGPRPERPVFVEQFKQVVPRYMERHKEKAGITGWAQVNGLRGETSIIERTKYDLYYIENWSLTLDLKIILRTVATWFRGDRHAY